jgi:hypothetical protein
MAIINDPNITAQLQALAQGGTIDSNDVVALLNSALPAGQQLQSGAGVTTGIYKRFGEFDKVNAKVEVVTTGLWSGDTGSLTAAFTSSTQVAAASGDYYYNVYNANPASDTSAEVQFGVAYGHVNGSGSVSLANSDDALLASKATYAQYKSILLDPTDSKFSFENGSGVATDSNDIYAVNINRARYREKMDPGNWSLNLSGSNGLFKFIDDSGKKFGDTLGKAGRVFKVVSGSLNLGTENAATINSTTSSGNEGFGLFYPDRGIIVLNPSAIGATVGDIDGQGNVSGSLLVTAEQENHKLLVNSIDLGADFQARRTENVSTQHFFVRATNREFNYSNNPTYVNTNGTFAETTFETDPKTYITTVGLLNDANELIAVAKTSQPIEKSFDKEVLIKVKLSF